MVTKPAGYARYSGLTRVLGVSGEAVTRDLGKKA